MFGIYVNYKSIDRKICLYIIYRDKSSVNNVNNVNK